MNYIKIVLISVFILSCGVVQAEDNRSNMEVGATPVSIENRDSSEYKINFVSVNVGASMLFGDHDKQCAFGDRLAPAFDVAFGHWFNEIFAARVMYSGSNLRGATKWANVEGTSAYGTGKEVPGKGGDPHYLQQQEFFMHNISASAMVNMTSIVGSRYSFATRPFNCVPYLGIGFAFVPKEPKTNVFNLNLGVVNTFRINDSFSLNIEARSLIFWNDKIDGEKGGNREDALLGVLVGASYKF